MATHLFSSCKSVEQRIVDAMAAAEAVQAAVAYAASIEVRVNVAVVDAGGVLATSQWSEALAQHSAAVRDGIVQRPRFVAFGGGLPILESGQRIGGIGVSGASEEQDEAIARAGLAAIGLEPPMA